MKKPTWKNIVVVISNPFGREQLALRKAAAIAARSGARLTLFNSFMMPQPTPDSMLGMNKHNIEVSTQDRLRRLERLAKPLRNRGIEVRCAVQWDYPIQDAIVRYVLRHKPSLLVAESHRHGRLARWVLANTDWELIRNCPCPLWFVRNRVLPQNPKVLVAVDPRHTHDKPAHLDDRLLVAAKTLVGQLGGQVAVVHAYETPVTAVSGNLVEPFRVPIPARKSKKFVAEATQQVETLSRKHGIPPKARYLLEGDATYVVTKVTQQYKADVLVMGAVSRSRLKRPFIGNTAEKVIDQVNCDVFVVKPAEFKSTVPRALPKI